MPPQVIFEYSNTFSKGFLERLPWKQGILHVNSSLQEQDRIEDAVHKAQQSSEKWSDARAKKKHKYASPPLHQFWKVSVTLCAAICIATGWNLECPQPLTVADVKNAGSKILKKPSWTAMFKCRIFTGSFGNEPSVGTLCEDSQVILKMSAAHRMPPAQTPAQNSRSRQKSEPHIFRILDLRSVFCT